jgi:hypothetical protein
MSKYPKTRRSYTYKQKLKILNDLEKSNYNAATFAKKINIPVRTLQKWQNSKKNLQNIDRKKLNMKRIGSGRKPFLSEEIENSIFQWFLDVRTKGIPVTEELLVNRARFEKKNSVWTPILSLVTGG